MKQQKKILRKITKRANRIMRIKSKSRLYCLMERKLPNYKSSIKDFRKFVLKNCQQIPTEMMEKCNISY